jgi:hypothetical protein
MKKRKMKLKAHQQEVATPETVIQETGIPEMGTTETEDVDERNLQLSLKNLNMSVNQDLKLIARQTPYSVTSKRIWLLSYI